MIGVRAFGYGTCPTCRVNNRPDPYNVCEHCQDIYRRQLGSFSNGFKLARFSPLDRAKDTN